MASASGALAGDHNDFSRYVMEGRREQMRMERMKGQVRNDWDQHRNDSRFDANNAESIRAEALQRQEEIRKEFERLREIRRTEWEHDSKSDSRSDGNGWAGIVKAVDGKIDDRGSGNGKPLKPDASDKIDESKTAVAKARKKLAEETDDAVEKEPPKTLSEAIKRIVKKSMPGNDLRLSKDFESFRPSEIIASNLDEAALKRALSHGFKDRNTTTLSGIGVTVHKLIAPAGMDMDEARRLLDQDAPGATLSLNHVYEIYNVADGEDDGANWKSGVKPAAVIAPVMPGQQGGSSRQCMGDYCFGAKLINWKPALASCSAPIKIGIIDTSFDLAHPALRGGRYYSGYFAEGNTPSRFDWHGTAVLSLLAGRPKSMTPGLAPDASYFLATAFRTDENGNASTDTMSLVTALDWLDQMGVNVINMSFSGPRDALVEKSIARLQSKGVVLVAAAGNNGPAAPRSYPAAYDGVIAVTAISKTMSGYRHANRGAYIDMAAPGVDVWTALPDGGSGYRSGTSLATPFATGVLASRLGAWKGPRDKPAIMTKLAFKDLGAPGRDETYGEGLLLAADSCAGYDSTVARKDEPLLPRPMAIGAWDAVTR